MKKFIRKTLFILSTPIALLLILDAIFPPNLSRLSHISPVYYDEFSEILQLDQSDEDNYRLPIKLSEVSPFYLSLLLAREDQRFYHHWGVDPQSLLRALWQNIQHQKIMSGASTLTMQTARLLEPRPRTFRTKLIDILRALQLEWHYPKSKILEFYLNLVPCGGNLEGIKTASLAYFDKNPDMLTWSESALLVALPQAPSQLRPDRFPERAHKKRDQILKLAQQQNLISKEDYGWALKEPIPHQRKLFPKDIPHLARLIASQTTRKSESTHTTLNASLQRKINDVLKQTQEKLPVGSNAAILVHDHARNKIVAYVGSIDFNAHENAGQIDYIQAVRSPGSTLKPLIYGLAFDQGLVTQETFFWDERKHFGAYAPQNFDKQHYGLVRASEALQMSLNIPAVELLKKMGPIHVNGLLTQCKIKTYYSQKSTIPNLSFALGGVGFKLFDLVKLYSAFAEEGQVKDLRMLSEQPDADTSFLMHPTSTQSLTEILRLNPLNRRGHLEHRNVALKTGTSYGYRDALALGYDDRYTVGVWVGMPKGETLGQLTGLDLAVPIFEQVFLILPQQQANLPKLSSEPVPAGFTTLRDQKEFALVPTKIVDQVPLHITFPVHQSHLMHSSQKNYPLSATGGKKPYCWFVNGRILQENVIQDLTDWKPENPGYYTLTLQDAEGKFDSVDIEISEEVRLN